VQQTLSKKINVLQIIPSLNIGGVERGVVEIARYCRDLDDKSIEVTVVSSGGSMVNYLLQNKIRHITLPVHSKKPWTIFGNICRIKKLIKELDIDIVHARSRAPAWSSYFACKKTNCKFVTTFHGSYSNKLICNNSKLKFWYNSIMTKGDKVIAVSNFIANHIKEYFPKFDKQNLRVIHRGVDIDKFNIKNISDKEVSRLINKFKIPADKRIIILPGRISRWKGHEFFLKALAKIKNKDYFCLIVGSGDKKFTAELENFITENNLEDHVCLAGKIEQMNVAYFLSDIVISASIRPEAFGRIAIEAGAMQRPIIATNIGGSLETIADGKTGILVENGNIDDFASKIDDLLLRSQEELTEMGKKARRKITRGFSNNLMFEKVISVYREVLR
jgi:glycosyltransferase involved in cell wall biosynthesis